LFSIVKKPICRFYVLFDREFVTDNCVYLVGRVIRGNRGLTATCAAEIAADCHQKSFGIFSRCGAANT